VIVLQVNNIVLATDFSEGGKCALDEALAWAQRFEATLHLLHVVTAPERLPMAMDLVLSEYKEEALGDLEAQAASKMSKLLESRRADNVPVETSVRRGEAAAPVVLDYAKEQDADLIVTGSHGRRGARRFMMGSTSEEVLRAAERPVLVARTCKHVLSSKPPGRVLVPVDFSEHSQRTVSYGREIAATYGAALDLVHVVEETSLPGVYGLEAEATTVAASEVRTETVQALEQLSETAGPEVEATPHVLDGHAARVIPALAEERESGLIVMASHGRTGLKRLAMGSVAEQVVRRAPCPVWVAKSFGKSPDTSIPS